MVTQDTTTERGPGRASRPPASASYLSLLPAFCASLFALCSTLSAAEPEKGKQAPPLPGPGPTPEQIEFFESKVRPVLIESCYSCHSAEKKKTKGGLALDSKAAMMKGGDSGPVLVPGEPDKSALVGAVKHIESFARMPPTGPKLSAEKIAALETWVKMGAPDPRDTAGKAVAGPTRPIQALLEKAKSHWSFRPVREPPVPAPANSANAPRVRNPVDAFVLAKLEATGLSPSAPADRRTLIRRAYLDLHGLPPTPEEVDAFVADPAPDAFAKLVDRLLASPRYGERWGRHWLDVARYADNQGSIFGSDPGYPYAYSYRDWVIRAFNEDMPFDRFVTLQLAADKLVTPDDNRDLAALGFITLGRRSEGPVNEDVIDDRIDAISKGLLGLTAACGRCHDHKVEPITTKDYYALYGILMSATEPAAPVELRKGPDSPQRAAWRTGTAKAEAEKAEATALGNQAALTSLRTRVGDYLLAAHETAGRDKDKAKGEAAKKLIKDRNISEAVVGLWEKALAGEFGQKTHRREFAPWREFSAMAAEPGLTPEKFAAKSAALTLRFLPGGSPDWRANLRLAALFAGGPPKDLPDLAGRYNALFARTDADWRALMQINDRGEVVAKPGKDAKGKDVPLPKVLPNREDEALRQVLYGRNSPANPEAKKLREYKLYPKALEERLAKAEKTLKELETHTGVPDRAMALEDKPKPHDARVFLRGNPQTPGEPAPRRFFEALGGADDKPFPKDTGGRLELARAVASPDNPLTARVIVNRVWQRHFGEGLVRTASDFGFRGDPPTHPELLDFLAARFVAGGWSIKKLHRMILLSSTWQQGSAPTPAGMGADPENRLLWRMPPLAMDFESFRDSLLAVSGRLDPATGGKAANLTGTDYSRRRTVYGFVDRKTLPNLFRSFDFPDPNYTSGRRNRTALTPQALFLMNSPFMADCARCLTARAAWWPGDGRLPPVTDPRRMAASLYRHALQREPDEGEIRLALDFLRGWSEAAAEAAAPAGKDAKPDPKAMPAVQSLSAWEALAQALLMSNEFATAE
jgi:cytochrome c553